MLRESTGTTGNDSGRREGGRSGSELKPHGQRYRMDLPVNELPQHHACPGMAESWSENPPRQLLHSCTTHGHPSVTSKNSSDNYTTGASLPVEHRSYHKIDISSFSVSDMPR